MGKKKKKPKRNRVFEVFEKMGKGKKGAKKKKNNNRVVVKRGKEEDDRKKREKEEERRNSRSGSMRSFFTLVGTRL
jgi:hypothetical protein